MNKNNPVTLILEPENYCEKAIRIFSKYSSVAKFTTNVSDKVIDNNKITNLVVRLKYHINRSFLQKYPNLKSIVSPTTGLNHIDLKYTKNNNICVISLKNETEFLSSVKSTSEFTWCLILSLVRGVKEAFIDVENGNWNRNNFPGYILNGKTLGIVGFGRIGKQLSQIALGFGMKVLVYDIHNSSVSQNMKFVDLPFLLKNSNIITNNLSYNKSTIEFFDSQKFSQMIKKPYFINTARGEIVDENALICALKTGGISGAALDVIKNEHILNCKSRLHNPLIIYAKSNNNLIITPHLGGNSPEDMRKTELFIAKKYEKWITSL